MTGRQQIVFGPDDFIKGMSTNTFLKDAGFSSEAQSINIAVTPGLAYGPSARTDLDSTNVITDEVIATSPSMVSFLGDNRLLVSENGSYYTHNGTAPTLRQTDSVNTYQKGFTDIITFAGEAYVTSKETVIRWQSPATFTNSFIAFTNTNRPHPALTYEDAAYFADRNLLLRITSAGGTSTTILTLSIDQEIVALGIDRGTGKILIGTTSSLNISNTLPGIHKLHWYDGFSNKTSKTVVVDDMITAFYPIGNVTYVGYGQRLGYISGSGINFLRFLKNVTLDQQDLPYKHNFTHIGSTLYVVDGDQILAYGPTQAGGSNVFYYLYLNDMTAAAKFKAICPMGSNRLAMSSVTTEFQSIDVTSVADTSNGLDVWTNWYDFPRPVILKGAQIEFVASTNTGNLTLQYRINTDTATRALAVEGGNYTGAFVVANLVGFLPTKITGFRIRIALASQNTGLRKLIVHYDYVE